MVDRGNEPGAGGQDEGDDSAAEPWSEPVAPDGAAQNRPQLLWRDRAGFDVVVVYIGGADEDARVVPIQSGALEISGPLIRLPDQLLEIAPRIEWVEGHRGTVGLRDVSNSFGINLLGPPPGPPTTPPPPWFRLRS